MLEIKGKYSTVICYAETVEQDAIDQIRNVCDQGFTSGSQVRMMLGVYWGKSGTAMTVTGISLWMKS